MRTTKWGKITRRFVNRVTGPDRTHGHRQPAAGGLGEMGGGGRDDAETEPRRQFRERGVAFVVERLPVVGELDADPVGAEPVNQIGERFLGGFWAAVAERLTDVSFATPGQDVPVAARCLGQRVVVV